MDTKHILDDWPHLWNTCFSKSEKLISLSSMTWFNTKYTCRQVHIHPVHPHQVTALIMSETHPCSPLNCFEIWLTLYLPLLPFHSDVNIPKMREKVTHSSNEDQHDSQMANSCYTPRSSSCGDTRLSLAFKNAFCTQRQRVFTPRIFIYSELFFYTWRSIRTKWL